MKKIFLALIAVLLAVMLVTCDLFSPPSGADDDLPRFTEDGRPMVHLTINIGDAGTNRAVNSTISPSKVNYYEVAFKDTNPLGGGKVYRLAWASSVSSPTISVPTGDYGSVEDAVLFAGIETGKILLAVGTLTDTDEGSGATGTTIINLDTESVTFTLVALENAVSTNKTTSTFKILGPTDAGSSYNHDNYSTAVLSSIPTVEIGTGNLYPVFDLPPKGYTYTNDLNFSTAGSTTNIVGHYSFSNPNFDGVVLASSWNFTSVAQVFGASSGVTVTITPKIPDNTDDLNKPIDGDFYFLIGVPGNAGSNGLSKIYIDVPVYAISDDNSTPINTNSARGTWHIHGGADKDDLDNGSNDGGAVLLAVGGEEFRYSPEIVDVELKP